MTSAELDEVVDRGGISPGGATPDGAGQQRLCLRVQPRSAGGASAGQVAAIIAASLLKWVGVALEDVDLGA